MSIDVIAGQLIETLRTKYGYSPEELSDTTDFEELGFDSLVFVELAVALENAYKVPLSEDELAETRSVRQIAELIADKASATAA